MTYAELMKVVAEKRRQAEKDGKNLKSWLFDLDFDNAVDAVERAERAE